MKWYKKILIGAVTLILLLVGLNIGLNVWIARRLPHVINEANDSPYIITYKNLQISLLDRNLKATDIVVVPKVSLKSEDSKAGLYAKIPSLEITSFNLWDIAFSNRIHAESLILSKPDITLVKSKKTKRDNPKVLKDDVVEPFSRLIYVSDVYINHGEVRMFYTDKKSILNVFNFTVKLEQIQVNEKTLAQKLPFSYGKYAVDCDSLFYQPDPFYHIKAVKLKTTHEDFKIGAFEMIPDDNRKAFVKKVPREKDQYTIKAKGLSINKLEWGFKENAFFLRSEAIVLDGVDANVYRSKMPDDDLTRKNLYNRLLREMPFDLKVDTLLITNSRLVYEEEKDFSKGPGILTFNKLNMMVTKIRSGYKQTKLPDVRIKVKCQFMDTAPLDVDWTFNVLDKSDGFTIKGRIYNFPVERLSSFTKPYINAELKGDFDEVYFNFTGNDEGSSGDFAINYDDLKVSVYKKNDRKNKNKLLSAVANLFVKKDTKDKVKSAEISIDRIKEKSFYNLLWRSIAEGLRKILI